MVVVGHYFSDTLQINKDTGGVIGRFHRLHNNFNQINCCFYFNFIVLYLLFKPE